MEEPDHVVLPGVRFQPSEFWDHITFRSPDSFHHQIRSLDFKKVVLIKAPDILVQLVLLDHSLDFAFQRVEFYARFLAALRFPLACLYARPLN